MEEETLQDEKIQDEKGSLMLYKNAREEDITLLLALLAKNRSEFLAVLKSVVNDNTKFLEILDIFAGFKLEFPDRKRVYKTLEKITMYNYIRNSNFSDESYRAMSKQFDKRLYQVEFIVKTMQNYIESNGIMTQEELESKLENIENTVYAASDNDIEKYERDEKRKNDKK